MFAVQQGWGARTWATVHLQRRTGVGGVSTVATPPRASAAANDVPLPLCKRPASHQDTLGNLLSWKRAVDLRIESIADAFVRCDDGPSQTELQREVTWVLEDVVGELQQGQGQPWQPCTWQLLQAELRAGDAGEQAGDTWRVKLRAPIAQLAEWWKRRLEDRVPYQYLTGTAHWRTYVLSVGPGVLIPRPETELLPELAETAVTVRPHLAALPWVDLGTGSGALAIAMADVLRKRCETARVLAVDISPVAAAYARANVQWAGMAQHVAVLQGSWLDPVWRHVHADRGASSPAGGTAWPEPRLGGVLSNPPYIPRPVVVAGLQTEVGRHEPLLALDGGPGAGLDSLSVICQQAADALAPGGFLGLETAGGEQAELVAQLLRSAGGGTAFVEVRTVLDYYGATRFVTAHRAPG